MENSVAVVLAAGIGTRMKSKVPKVLHKMAGKPMLEHVLTTLRKADVHDIILVLGHKGELVKEELGKGCHIVYQQAQLGTGHALLQALPKLQQFSQGDCLVLCGDTPLLRAETLISLRSKHRECKAQATILTAEVCEPTGYGRIIKNTQCVQGIVEEKDATVEERLLKEINTGTYCFDVLSLKEKLAKLKPANAQGEYYLTDVIKLCVQEGERVEVLLLDDSLEAMGINTRVHLAQAEKIYRQRILNRHMLNGVTIIHPENTYIDEEVEIGMDTIIYPGTILEGKTIIGEDCLIGPYTRISDSNVGNRARIQQSVLLEAQVEDECTIGPYSYLRPGSILSQNVKVGDFVEVKNSKVGKGSKIPHLSYIGDCELGENVNIGAGTITCNYDGKEKFVTLIKDNVFIGSNSNLVAPVVIGKDAYIGAGSTITEDVPEHALAVARGKQCNIEQWKNNKEGTE